MPADVKGLKAASASNKVSAMTWTTLGANPTPIGITEIASAFQTGLADVNGTVVTFYLPSGLAKVAPVLTRVELSDAPGIILMNKAVYDKLPAAEKAALEKAVAKRSADQLRKEIRGFEETLRADACQGRRHDRHADARAARAVAQGAAAGMAQDGPGSGRRRRAFYKEMEAAREGLRQEGLKHLSA